MCGSPDIIYPEPKKAPENAVWVENAHNSRIALAMARRNSGLPPGELAMRQGAGSEFPIAPTTGGTEGTTETGSSQNSAVNSTGAANRGADTSRIRGVY